MDELNYPILFGPAAYPTLSDFINQRKYSAVFILADTHSNEYCVPRLLSSLAVDCRLEVIECEAGEAAKNIETCVELWQVLTELGADRKTVIVNVGGGVVTDLGGFVASTFKRGIDFIHVPTTLLAMVDAAIGGKNGVDLGVLKNQVGVIRPPAMLVIDPEFLETLPQREMRSGLAEMLKHGLIYDKDYWKQFLDLQADASQLEALILRSVEIKSEIVSQDLTENGIRKALNFGHTLGHAIESHFLESDTKETLLHGEAIAAGMVLEAFISREKGLLTAAEYAEIKYVLTDLFGTVTFEQTDLEPILDLLRHDKKNEYGAVRFALLEGIGGHKIDESASKELIYKAFEDYQS